MWQLHRAQQRFEDFQNDITQGVDDLNVAVSALIKNRVIAYRYATQTDPSIREHIRRQFEDTVQTAISALTRYEQANITDVEDKALLEKDKETFARFISIQHQFLELCDSNQASTALAMQEDGAPARVASLTAQGALEAHVKYNVDAGRELRSENSSAYSQSLRILIVGISGVTLVCAVLGIHLQRSVSRSLGGMQSALQRARTSLDLTQRAPVERSDEIGQTATAFNELQEKVKDVMTSVRHAAELVSIASREIASGNVDLSVRTEEQAAALEETASSMTELTETVRQNAGNARQANSLADDATTLAMSGDVSVRAMMESISKIQESSGKIAEITGVIEGIAFQTNILALNASVEAARAGEQGRGFAVVASEVRSLAQRSSAAAKEIASLIGESVVTVQGGVEQATKVSTTMGQVKQAIKRVSDIVGDIADASEEQNAGIEQIGRAITQMDEVTQQNAALVEQATAAAQSLEQQAESLNRSVSQFQITADDFRSGARTCGKCARPADIRGSEGTRGLTVFAETKRGAA